MVWSFPLTWIKQGPNEKWCPERKMTLQKGRQELKKRRGSGNVQREKGSDTTW